MGYIVDIVIIAILAIGAISGYRKGFVAIMEKMLYLVVVGILAIALKPVGVSVIETTSLPETISNKTQQIILENVGDKLDQITNVDQLSQTLTGDVLPESMAKVVTEKLAQAGQVISQDKAELIQSIGNVIADFVVGAIAVIVLFVLLSIAYFLIFKMLGLVVKLPIFKQADQILGVAGGLISSLITVAIILCVLTVMVPFLPEVSAALSSSVIYGLYAKII